MTKATKLFQQNLKPLIGSNQPTRKECKFNPQAIEICGQKHNIRTTKSQ